MRNIHSIFKILSLKFILPQKLQTYAQQEILDLKGARADCNKVGSSENNLNLFEIFRIDACKLLFYMNSFIY